MRVSLNESPAAQNPGIFIGFGPPYAILIVVNDSRAHNVTTH